MLCLPSHVSISPSGLSVPTLSRDLWDCGLLQSLMSQSVLAGPPLQPSTANSASQPSTPSPMHGVGWSCLSAILHIVPLGVSHASFSHCHTLALRRLCPEPQWGRSVLKTPITHPFNSIMIQMIMIKGMESHQGSNDYFY